MSTSIREPAPASSLKQEVSERLAAHRIRRGFSKVKPAAASQSCIAAGNRASLAAARVAARYAHTPSFSQMQAAETVALSATLPFDPGGSAGTIRAKDEEPEFVLRAPEPATEYLFEAELPTEKPIAERQGGFNPRVKPIKSKRTSAPKESFPLISPESPNSSAACEGREVSAGAAVQMETSQRLFAVSPVENRWEQPALDEIPWDEDELSPVEPDLPIYANLIEFPRELVAPSKRRPQLAERPFAADGLEKPLSILEVDPGLLTSESGASDAAFLAPAWPEPEWSGIKLEAQPAREPQRQDEPAARQTLHLAPISHRLMAVLVDGALITAAFLGAVLVAAAHIVHPPAVKVLELSAASALLLVALLYQVCFFTLTEATPGMRYARISLCTFDGQIPTRAQLRSRLGALLLSVLPVGLGVAWALFDEDRLSWHDRLSRTYLRKN